ncbi:MAG: nucleoid-associated protein [Lachnospiraceae bacterium]|nr:nucleoid-associated protein [Lachnospiraceae bacterium]
MTKGDIYLKDTVVHILDSSVGMPVLSDSLLQYGSDFADFLKEHIYRVMTSDDIKKCQFVKEESEVYEQLTKALSGEMDFLTFSRLVAEKLYGILNSNIDIPAADLVMACFEINQIPHMALLKMNYKESYMHQTMPDDGGNVNSIIKYRSILPSETQKLSEAALIRLDDYSIKLIEKKYDINGKKENYFSQMFLNCSTKLSQKAKLAIVEKAVESVQKEFFNESEQFEEKMKAKSIIHKEMEEQGEINITEVASKVFENKVDLKEKFKEKIEKYNIKEDEPIKPVNEATTRKFGKQQLMTDTGIEIKIPMEQYNSTDSIEFITNQDGTISVLIKNIGKITSK